MHTHHMFVVIFAASLLGLGCQGQEGGSYPSFSLGSADSPGSDDIAIIQDIGTNTEVRGRFQASHQYRGFTFEAQQGDRITIQMQAELESNGFLTGDSVDAQVLLFAPSEQAGFFDQVVQDSGLGEQAVIQAEVEQSGTYLVAVTRDEEVDEAQFELEVQCDECQQDPQPAKVCEEGRLYVEGYNLRSQEWNRCQVILLEPAELPEDETLTIGPDVNVRAHYYITDYHSEGFSETKLTISGELKMSSDAEHPVVFQSNIPGRQWAGIEILRPETEMHDFVIRDTYGGLRVVADDVTINGGVFSLNRVGLNLGNSSNAGTVCPRNTTVAGSAFYENDIGIATACARTIEGLSVADSELSLNDVGMSLNRLASSELSGLSVHDNEDGVRIWNLAVQDTPEDYVTVASSVFSDNVRALTLEGNGLVTDSKFRSNGEYGVLFDRTSQRFSNRTTWNAAGWNRLRNSLVAENGEACQWPEDDESASFQADISCGGVVIQRGVHSVIRNNIVRDNKGFGVVIRGETGTENVTAGGGGDPAVLNSEIKGNLRGGIFFVDSPIFSVEYNIIQGNGGTEIALGYTVEMRWGVTTTYDNETRTHTYRYLLRANRFQFNNVYPETALFAFHNDPSREVISPSTGFHLVMTENYFAGASHEEVKAQVAFELVDLDPVLNSPSEWAGLVRPLDF